MIEAIQAVITHPVAIASWLIGVVVSMSVLLRDLATKNRWLDGVMRYVWILTVLYSGPLGLALYWWSGRRQIACDTDLRRGARSVAHCYSGCGAGEVTGIVIAVGLLGLGNVWVVAVTFTLAYVFGIALTLGPLMQDGEPFGTALKDALASETASITVMEIVAITVDLILAGEATIGEPLFWASLIVSLTLGLAAAYPVNLLLIRHGVKEGMMNPRNATPVAA